MRAVDFVTAAGLTGLAFVTPHRLTRGRLAAYVAANCALAGVVTADAVRLEAIGESYEEGLVVALPESVGRSVRERPAPTLLAVGLAGAAATAAIMPFALKTDHLMHDWLERRGVRHPRVVIAALTGATAALSTLTAPGDAER